jgi:PhzF family phenazine biosynthesis protein
MAASIPFAQVDAFSAEPFRGNPAAVFILNGDSETSWMQRVAGEMRVANTAFVRARPAGDGFDLRWFTPRVEVQLCGHATLATAHVLWERGILMRGAVARFHTASGVLTAAANDGWIELDFPATPVEPLPGPPGVVPDLVAALGVDATWIGRSAFDYIVQVEHEDAVRAVRPDLPRLASIGGRGVIVTAPAASPDADFVSRFFAPAVGVDEDAATGSAHCCLGPFWAERLGKVTMVARQLSEREATIRVAVRGDRVRVAGQAVTVINGSLTSRAG